MGCGKRDRAADVAPPRAYVRLAPLVADHPLREEIRRLNAAEANLRRIGSASGSRQPLGAYDLPALSLSDGGGGVGASRRALRAQQRDLLQATAAREIRAYLDALRSRQERLIEQRTEAMLAAFAARDAIRARESQQVVDEQILKRLLPLVQEKLLVRARIAILRAQLPQAGSASVFLEPFRGDEEAREQFRAELAKLAQDPNAFGISWRARLAYQRQQEERRLESIDAQIGQIMSEGGAARGTVSELIRAQRLAEIEAELAKLRDEPGIEAILREQGQAIDAALAAEARAAAAADAVASRQAGGAAGAVRFGDLFGRTEPAGLLGAAAAADQVARQRAALERFVEQSVMDAVRDAAQMRGIDVTIDPNTAAGGGDAKGRVDMTADFAKWVRFGGQTPGPTGGGRV